MPETQTTEADAENGQAADAMEPGETPESTTAEATTESESPGSDELAGLKNALASERDKRKTAERQAKRVKALEAELTAVREQSMSEAEKQLAKATAEAADTARRETRTEMGARLVRAELRSEAAGKVADIDAVLDDLDLTRFVGEDGAPDARAIKAAVARFAKLAPAEKPVPPFNGGARGEAPATGMDQLIRQKAGLA